MRASERIEPQPWMTMPATAAVLAALTARGETVRFVGGCVRDTLAGRAITDIDIATPDPPATVRALAEAAALEAHPTGIAHGTVTVVARGRAFQVTTLRHDVETFGRHARVAFTEDWAGDAARRDFTFNALYLDPDGTLYDPHGGRADLAAGRVRFVGEAAARIDEDVLRLLRFFRFFAWYGRPPADAGALAACAAAAARLADLSGQRVQAELLRLLAAPDPLPALALMAEHGVLTQVVPHPRPDWQRRLAALVTLEAANGEPIRRLAAMVGDGATALAERLRLSRAHADRLALLVAPAPAITAGMDHRAARRALYRLGKARTLDLALLAAADGEAADFAPLLALAEAWQAPALPVQGRDALALGVAPGPRVGALLREIEAWWIESDFQPGREAALARLEGLIAEVDS